MATISNDIKIRILTVGDGDLSLSLALARAYGKYITLTASVLDSKESLHASFPNSPSTLVALAKLGVEVLYEVDATQLHELFKQTKFDLVCFHHPHLGLGSLTQNEADHAHRHFQLLSHYLYSASAISDSVHLCLCGRQPETWRVEEAATLNGLEIEKRISTSVPFSKLWTEEELSPSQAKPEHAAPRRYWSGKLGSQHMLGKFGYGHRRTEGTQYTGRAKDTNVAGSMHFLFRTRPESNPVTAKSDIPKLTCKICRSSFSTKMELEEHMRVPALPNTTSTTVSRTTAIARNFQDPRRLPDSQETPSSISCTTNEDGTGAIIKVTKEYEGKRLRWLIQHGIKALSKKQAKVAIQGSQVLVNNSLVLDASRVLSFGDVVLVKSAQPAIPSTAKVEILYRNDPMLVAFKPRGMRTKGQFPGTLESSIEQQEGRKYDALSSLDSFCPGLCALVASDYDGKLPTIVHSLTALVFNAVPESWRPHREVTITIDPKWKKRKRDVSPQNVSVRLTPLGTTNVVGDSMQLTTIRLETQALCTPSSICKYLRNASHGVVGDSNCRQEYLKVQRSIRNRIKDKLCMGCYQIEFDSVEVTKNIPEKLLWSFWDTHCEESKTILK